MYALSAGYGASTRRDAVVRWQGSGNLDRDGRGTGVAIINPLTDEIKYEKFDTVHSDEVCFMFWWIFNFIFIGLQ